MTSSKLVKWVVSLVLLLVCSVGFSQDDEDSSEQKEPSMVHQGMRKGMPGMGMMGMRAGAVKKLVNSPECAELKAACNAAGFKVGQVKSGMGLIRDCMAKVSRGQEVPGVKLKSSAQACGQKIEKMRAKRKQMAGMAMRKQRMKKRKKNAEEVPELIETEE